MNGRFSVNEPSWFWRLRSRSTALHGVASLLALGHHRIDDV
jgi:hypothetical protein